MRLHTRRLLSRDHPTTTITDLRMAAAPHAHPNPAPAAAPTDDDAPPSSSAPPAAGGDDAPTPGGTRQRAQQEHFAYQSCYCEENTYLLLRRLIERADHETDSLYAVFVSNERRQVPIWRQRSAERRGEAIDPPCVWDYHVFAAAAQRRGGHDDEGNHSLVYDLDTTLDPFPCEFEQYRREALRPPPPTLTRRYRVVPARELFARFSSDRSHMRTADGDGWAMPPPPWPPIGRDLSDKHTLPSFLDMRGVGGGGGDSGLLLDEAAFFEFFAPARRREQEEEAQQEMTTRAARAAR